MTLYHVRLSVQGESHDEVKVDMDEQTLERQILAPYRVGSPITISGTTIPMSKLERISVSASDEPSSEIIARLRLEDRSSEILVVGGPGYAWRAAARARDVTDQFITGPAGSAAPVISTAQASQPGATLATVAPFQAGDPAAVFVVAGRDSRAVTAVVELLRSLGLRIVEWEHAVAKTGLPNPYVGDIVETGLRMAGAAIVILSPDDLVQLRPDLVRDNDSVDEREVRGQARPNVYYEAGIADTLGRDRTVIVEIGSVKSFSDAAGRHVVRYDGSPAKRNALAERLRLAGLDVDTAGQNWLSAGDVAPALEAASNALAANSAPSSGAVVDRDELLEHIEVLDGLYKELKENAEHDDFSDRPQESLQYVMRSQAMIDRLAAGTAYAAEADRVRASKSHVRIPVLRAALESLRAEIDG